LKNYSIVSASPQLAETFGCKDLLGACFSDFVEDADKHKVEFRLRRNRNGEDDIRPILATCCQKRNATDCDGRIFDARISPYALSDDHLHVYVQKFGEVRQIQSNVKEDSDTESLVGATSVFDSLCYTEHTEQKSSVVSSRGSAISWLTGTQVDHQGAEPTSFVMSQSKFPPPRTHTGRGKEHAKPSEMAAQLHLKSASFVEAAAQTDNMSTSLPPKPSGESIAPQHPSMRSGSRFTRSRSPSFSSRSTLVPLCEHFAPTPEQTLAFLISDSFSHMNLKVRRERCCNWHGALEAFVRFSSNCRLETCKYWEVCTGWQCESCQALNIDQTSDCEICGADRTNE